MPATHDRPGLRRRTLTLATALALATGGAGLTADAHADEVADAELLARIEALPDALRSRILLPAAQPDIGVTATRTVANCNDSGPGSLRAVVATSANGDVVDLTGLDCSITLSSSIVTPVGSLTIKANPVFKYPYHIQGNGNDRVITHNGSGTLTLDGVLLGEGRVKQGSIAARGGCIFSRGDVLLTNQSRVSDCAAVHLGYARAEGGAIYAQGTVSLTRSKVTRSSAESAHDSAFGGAIFSGGSTQLYASEVSSNRATGRPGHGGGIFARGDLVTKYSTLSGNEAVTTPLNLDRSTGGGATSLGKESLVMASTISGNRADLGAGLRIGSYGGTSEVVNSTIVNNVTTSPTDADERGGALVAWGQTRIENSTIHGNSEQAIEGREAGAGLSIGWMVDVEVSSSIVSGNIAVLSDGRTVASDIGQLIYPLRAMPPGAFPIWAPVIEGSHNLFGELFNATAPPDTIFTNAPGLGPLRYNGGSTRTMAPLPNSPARNRGVANNHDFDQRGHPYPRVVGTTPDIGALELDDRIFENGFQRP